MKSSRHAVMLMPPIAMLALAISFLTIKSAQAAPPRQAAEDPIKATLEDANQSLGGGFVLDPNGSAMNRTRQGAYTNGDPAAITDYLSITPTTPNTYCESLPQESWQTSTFHGLPGCSLPYGDHPANVVWEAPAGSQSQGDNIVLDVGSIVDDCYCYVQHPGEGPRVSYDSINALPLAEALNRAAIKNGLYEPMPGEIMPTQPGPSVPGQPGVPADAGGPSGIPLPIILGSLGIPVLGALTGTGVSILTSILDSANSPDAARRLAEDANALQDSVPGLAGGRLAGLNVTMEGINQDLQQSYYVANPLQGDPTVLSERVHTGFNVYVWDNTAGWLTGKTGIACGDYVEKSSQRVLEAVKAQYGPDARVENVVFEEKSSVDPQSLADYCDKAINTDNHTLTKVTLPDGSKWSVDFHQHNSWGAGNPPILRPWDEAEGVWSKYMGKEFTSRTSSVLSPGRPTPQP